MVNMPKGSTDVPKLRHFWAIETATVPMVGRIHQGNSRQIMQ